MSTKFLILLFILFTMITNSAFSKSWQENGVSLVYGEHVIDGMVDGNYNTASLDYPREINILGDKKTLFVADSNGWRYRLLDDEKLTSLYIEDEPVFDISYEAPLTIKNKLNIKANLFINNEGKLVWLKPKSEINIKNKDLAFPNSDFAIVSINLLAKLSKDLQAKNSNTSKNPLEGALNKVLLVDNKYWLILNPYERTLYKLDTLATLESLPLPENLNMSIESELVEKASFFDNSLPSDLKDFTVDTQGNVWLMSTDEVTKIAWDKQKHQLGKVLQRWRLNEMEVLPFDEPLDHIQENTNNSNAKTSSQDEQEKISENAEWYADEPIELEHIAVNDKHALVIDKANNRIIELSKQGNARIVFKSRCDLSYFKTNDTCYRGDSNYQAEIPAKLFFNGLTINPFNEGFIVSEGSSDSLFEFNNNFEMTHLIGQYATSLHNPLGYETTILKESPKLAKEGTIVYGFNINKQILSFNAKDLRVKTAEPSYSSLPHDRHLVGQHLIYEKEGNWKIEDILTSKIHNLNISPSEELKPLLKKEGYDSELFEVLEYKSNITLDNYSNNSNGKSNKLFYYITHPETHQLLHLDPEGNLTVALNMSDFKFPPLDPDIALDKCRFEIGKLRGKLEFIVPFNNGYRIVDAFGYVYNYNPATSEINIVFELNNFKSFKTVTIDSEGYLWLIDADRDLWVASPTGKHQRVFYDKNYIGFSLNEHLINMDGLLTSPIPRISDILIDSEDNLWLASQSGIYLIRKNKIQSIKHKL